MPARRGALVEPERQWILVAATELRQAASPLVQRRKQQNWNTLVITVQPVAGGEKHARHSAPAAGAIKRELAELCASFPGMTSILIIGR